MEAESAGENGHASRGEHPVARGPLAARPRIDSGGGELAVLRRDPAWLD